MSRSLLLSAVLCLVLALPQPVPAFDTPGCGGNWSGSQTCSMVFVGAPLSVFATATTSEAARVRVWISPAGSPEVPLWECSAQGSGSATCGTETPDDGIENLGFPPGTRPRLQCNVSGRSSGTYFCGSGTSEGS